MTRYAVSYHVVESPGFGEGTFFVSLAGEPVEFSSLPAAILTRDDLAAAIMKGGGDRQFEDLFESWGGAMPPIDRIWIVKLEDLEETRVDVERGEEP